MMDSLSTEEPCRSKRRVTRMTKPDGLSPRTLRTLLIACTVSASLLLTSGCVYRINIAQGNFLEAKQVDQLAVGMTKSQVRFLLGTPMINDAFHPERWDYLYYFKDGKSQKIDRRLLTVHFADDKVTRIERPPGEWKDPKIPRVPGA
jgi:outer membrane protein assembly factor BamE